MQTELTTTVAIAALANLLSQRLRQFQQRKEDQRETAEDNREINEVTRAYYEVLNRAASIMRDPELMRRIDSNETKALELWLEEIKMAKEPTSDELQRIARIDQSLQKMVATP